MEQINLFDILKKEIEFKLNNNAFGNFPYDEEKEVQIEKERSIITDELTKKIESSNLSDDEKTKLKELIQEIY